MDSEYGDGVPVQSPPQPINFRLVHYARPLYVDWECSEPLEFHFGNDDVISLTIRAPREDERAPDFDIIPDARDDALCIAQTMATPTAAVYRMFTVLAQEGLPAGSRQIGFPNILMALPDAPNDLHLNDLPDPLAAFGKGVYERLLDVTVRTVSALRWRVGIAGPHMPLIGHAHLEWSLDGKSWRWQRNNPPQQRETINIRRVSSDLIVEVQRYVERNHEEPLGHVLWREAWAQRITNPRSALIVGMTAAEVGMKQCIGALVPDAEWLVTNVPSPPLMKMISDYLPTLPVQLKVNDKVLSPPKYVRKALQEGVEWRNKTAHVGEQGPWGRELDSILLAVRDLLWMLDYYSGTEWALERLQEKTRHELGLPLHWDT